MRKWYSLIDKVYSVSNLGAAYESVKRNKGSRTAGIDGQSMLEFGKNLDAELSKLSKELRTGHYAPSPVKRVWIVKPDGSQRVLGIPTVRDRVVQQSLRMVLEPIFEADFHPSSYGYRPNRSAHHAVAKAERFSRHYGLSHVADIDLSKCFDTLDHELILSSLNRKVSDGKILGLVNSFLKAGVMSDEGYEPSLKGSPQGGIISPLLMNIYLDYFDQQMKGLGIRIVRYADDILLFGVSKSEVYDHLQAAIGVLEHELKLTINKEKSGFSSLWTGISYLGFEIRSYGVIVSKKSIKNFKDKVRALTPRRMGREFSSYLKELNALLRGFSTYFKLGKSANLLRNLMKWIRHRLRMMIFKSWKSWRGLHRQLRRMGYKGSFEKIAMNRWRNAKCTLAHMALPNRWFESQGLFDMHKVTSNTLHQYFDQVLNKV